MSAEQPCKRKMMGADGLVIGGITGGIVEARMEIVRGNNPGGQKHPVGHWTMKL